MPASFDRDPRDDKTDPGPSIVPAAEPPMERLPDLV